MSLEQQIVTDMGLLSQLSYLDFGVSPILEGQSISQFEDEGKTYVLNSSYTVRRSTSTENGMQEIQSLYRSPRFSFHFGLHE